MESILAGVNIFLKVKSAPPNDFPSIYSKESPQLQNPLNIRQKTINFSKDACVGQI